LIGGLNKKGGVIISSDVSDDASQVRSSCDIFQYALFFVFLIHKN
jgi:hypothetical protein